MPVKITKDRLGEILKSVKALNKSEVLVGVPDINAEREREPGETGPPASNATIGYAMEFGVPEKNIPARPFLIPGIRDAQDKIVARLKKGAIAALGGDTKTIDKELNTIGLIGQKAVQVKIASGPFEPLSERTLKAREARGRTGTKPLLDTGQLRRAITFVLQDKGKK